MYSVWPILTNFYIEHCLALGQKFENSWLFVFGKKKNLEERFWNILDEKEFLDNKQFDFTYTVVTVLD